MNSVPRKLTLGLGLALVVAACGDDVTVQEAPQPTPGLRSVVVSPSSATVAPGGSFTFGAAVDADAGLARTVTWSSSNTAVANVDQSGVATASASPAGGVTSVCAASTVDANVRGCAQLTVTQAAAPATIQIDQTTTACTNLAFANPSFAACGILAPVATNNVFAQIDVAVLIQRPSGGNSGITGVRLEILNAAGVVEDTYTETLAGDFLNTDETSVAFQQGLSNRVTFSVQTAKYDLSGPGGTAKVFHPNGQKRLRATLIGGSGATSTAETSLFFRNANGFHVTVTNNIATGNNENGLPIRQVSVGTGLAWVGGTDLAVQAIPVSYTGQAVIAAGSTVNFGLPGCDVTLGPRGIAATLTAGILSGTINYTAGAAAAVGNLSSYQTSFACAPAGETPFATAVDATNNPFINIALVGFGFGGNTLNNILNPIIPNLSTVTAIRLDNLGPAAATIAGNMNGRAFGWFNGGVLLSTRAAVNANGTITNNPADAGPFAAVTFTAHAGACTSAATCGALAARTSVTDAPAIAESATGATYSMIVRALDTFGNWTASNVLPFGVDVTLPTVIVTLGAINNQIIQNQSLAYQQGATLFADVNAAASTYSAQDATVTVGAIPSGIAGPNNVRVINARRDGATTQFWCPPNAQFQPAAGACAGATGWAAGTQRFVSPAGVISADPTAASPSVDAYFGVIVDAVDNAGNVSTTTGIRNVVNDVLAGQPAAFGALFLPAVIPTNGAVTLQGSGTENLDGARAAFATNFPALAAGATAIRYPWATAGAGQAPGGLTPTGFNFAGPSLQNPTYTSAITLPRTIEQVDGTQSIVAATNATVAVNGFMFFNWDVVRNPSNVVAPAIGIGSTGLVGGSTAAWAAADVSGFMGAIPLPPDVTWQMCASGAPFTSCAAFATDLDVSGNGTAAANTRLLQAVLNSVGTNPFQPPFLGGVKFYVVDNFQNAAFGNPAGSALVEVCTAGPPFNDQATNTWVYGCSYTPSALRVAHDLFGFDETLSAAQLALVSLGGADNVAVPVIAIGYNTTGAGLATNPLAITHDR